MAILLNMGTSQDRVHASRKYSKYVSAIWVIFTLLSTFGVDTTAIVTGVGIITLAVGLGSELSRAIGEFDIFF